MVEFLFVFCCAIVVGILTGLLPALPIWTGMFILLYFNQKFSVEIMMMFWLVSVTGSQFFGSLSTITTKIAGEESSTVYIKDIDSLSISDRGQLLYDTAFGSFIATILSLIVVYLSVSFNIFPSISSISNQLILYGIAILSFMILNKNIFISILLIIIGIFLSPSNNYTLPHFWYESQLFFHGYTIYMLLLGLLIIPDLLTYNTSTNTNDYIKTIYNKTVNKLLIFKSSIVGIIVGFIPGPSAFMASWFSYNLFGKNVKDKIVAAESSNNASVLSCILPLIILGIPINQNTLLFHHLMELGGVNIVEYVKQSNILLIVCCSVAISSIIYYFLSTRFIALYVNFLNYIQYKIKYVLVSIVTLLIAIDISVAEITTLNYITMLCMFSIGGYYMKKYDINPLPLLFSVILGDRIIWLCTQYYYINF